MLFHAKHYSTLHSSDTSVDSRQPIHKTVVATYYVDVNRLFRLVHGNDVEFLEFVFLSSRLF